MTRVHIEEDAHQQFMEHFEEFTEQTFRLLGKKKTEEPQKCKSAELELRKMVFYINLPNIKDKMIFYVTRS